MDNNYKPEPQNSPVTFGITGSDGSWIPLLSGASVGDLIFNSPARLDGDNLTGAVVFCACQEIRSRILKGGSVQEAERDWLNGIWPNLMSNPLFMHELDDDELARFHVALNHVKTRLARIL